MVLPGGCWAAMAPAAEVLVQLPVDGRQRAPFVWDASDAARPAAMADALQAHRLRAAGAEKSVDRAQDVPALDALALPLPHLAGR